jgi:YrbI family 3-deoxy-D-manno-octulosonate 8-phosphate phosphatase
MKNWKNKIVNLRALILDFDGVMTDNTVILSEDGTESVTCHRGDGLGISEVKRLGVYVCVLSSEKNSVVQARCTKLGIDCYSGAEDKLDILKGIAKSKNINSIDIAYIGNDINDRGSMEWVGLPVCVSDAARSIIEISSIVLEKSGGKGAVREFCDLVLKYRGEG